MLVVWTHSILFTSIGRGGDAGCLDLRSKTKMQEVMTVLQVRYCLGERSRWTRRTIQ